MGKVILFIPSEEAIDRSLDARAYVNRLAKRVHLETRRYDASTELGVVAPDVDSVAVLTGLSSLELESGYMEMELETVFRPQELLKKLRPMLPADFPVVAIVDDAYSDYLMVAYLKAGASAVVGTSGDLFGLVTSRINAWERLFPYLNIFRKV
jgi:hypothetical protein